MATKNKSKNLANNDNGKISAGAATLFAATAVILVGNLQNQENLQLLLVGFGTCLLVLGAVILALATKKPVKNTSKKSVKKSKKK